jgi:hypothetical protein
MLEPTTISVPNLAARWNQTPDDILAHATELRLHLLFNFNGLAFDLAEEWLRGGQDTIQRRELQSLADFVERAEAKFTRRRNGQLSQWESLDHDEAVALRAEVTTANRQIKALKELLDERDRKRQQQHYRGALMAAPATVQELLRLGFTKHPLQAFRPEGPFCLREIDGVRVLEGPIVWLESAGSKWKECLEPADMVVSMAAVKAIEAAAKPQQTATDTATPAPVVEETSTDRRARWLDMREDEESRVKRGALQRVYERELLTNPKADRSYIGKEIKIAKKERKEVVQGGAMFEQLVRNGKRTN